MSRAWEDAWDSRCLVPDDSMILKVPDWVFVFVSELRHPEQFAHCRVIQRMNLLLTFDLMHIVNEFWEKSIVIWLDLLFLMILPKNSTVIRCELVSAFEAEDLLSLLEELLSWWWFSWYNQVVYMCHDHAWRVTTCESAWIGFCLWEPILWRTWVKWICHDLG